MEIKTSKRTLPICPDILGEQTVRFPYRPNTMCGPNVGLCQGHLKVFASRPR